MSSSRTRMALSVLTCTILLAMHSDAAATISIDIGGTGPNGTINLNETVTVSVYADAIPAGNDGNGLFGFGFSIVYDDTLLSSSSATSGPFWTGTGNSASFNNPDDVGMTANRLFMADGPSGNNILLASIDFTGDSIGSSIVAVIYYTGCPGDNFLFEATVLDTSSSFFQSGSINVVPEPHTALLFGLGLMFLGVRQRTHRCLEAI